MGYLSDTLFDQKITNPSWAELDNYSRLLEKKNNPFGFIPSIKLPLPPPLTKEEETQRIVAELLNRYGLIIRENLPQQALIAKFNASGRKLKKIPQARLSDYVDSPRKAYLMLRYFYLQAENPTPVATPIAPKSIFYGVFDFFKKIVDVADDVWNSLRTGTLPTKLIALGGPLITGGIGIFIYGVEGYRAFKDTYLAQRDKDTPHRQLKIQSGTAIGLISLGGLGLSIAYGLTFVGVKLLLQVLFPFVISAGMSIIYAINLAKNIHLLRNARQRILEKANKIDQQKIKELKKELSDLVTKLTTSITSCESIIGQASHKGKIVIPNFKTTQEEIQKKQKELNELLQPYQIAKKEYDELKELIGFNIIELTCSILVLVGLALGISLFVGASIASFGALPTALIWIGVAVGFVMKVVEFIDSLTDHFITKSCKQLGHNIANYFSNLFARPKRENVTVNTLSSTALCEKVWAKEQPIFFTKLEEPEPQPIILITESVKGQQARLFAASKLVSTSSQENPVPVISTLQA